MLIATDRRQMERPDAFHDVFDVVLKCLAHHWHKSGALYKQALHLERMMGRGKNETYIPSFCVCYFR